MINQKLTTEEDIELFQKLTARERIGYGEDTHRLTEGRRLVIGGVEIPYRLGLMGHSDADVLIHAVIDALLGAAAMGDIGRLFPDSSPEYKDMDSLILLKRAWQMVHDAGYEICSVDATVIAQEPKLAPYIDNMRRQYSRCHGVRCGHCERKGHHAGAYRPGGKPGVHNCEKRMYDKGLTQIEIIKNRLFTACFFMLIRISKV